MTQQNNQAVAVEQDLNPTGNVQQFLTFVLSDEVYGVGILHIREIIEYTHLTLVPLMPDFISGVINLRGNVVPVVNLARRFEQTPKDITKRTSIVIIDIPDGEGESIEIGIIVDIVNEVIELADTDIASPPTFGTRIRSDFIEGMGKIDDRLMILLDVGRVLSINELSAVVGATEEMNAPSAMNGTLN